MDPREELAKIRAARKGKTGRLPRRERKRIEELEAMIAQEDKPSADNAALEGDGAPVGSTESAPVVPVDEDSEEKPEAPTETPDAPDAPVEGMSRARVLVSALSVPASTKTGIAKVKNGEVFDAPEDFVAAMVELERVERV